MAKVKTHEINPREKYYTIGIFFDMVTDLNTKREVIDFLIGALTPSEILMVARRIRIAKMILEGNDYESIRKELKVGYQNIASVQKLLQRKGGGYKKQIEKLLEKEKRELMKNNNMKVGLLKRYPQHNFLSELFS